MQTKEKIMEKVNEILNDERFWYEPANVMINAPLALIQVDLTGRLIAYAFALGTTVKELKDNYKK